MENNFDEDYYYQQVKLILSKKRKQEAFKAVIAGAIFGTTEGGLFGIGSTTIEGLANKSFAYAAAKDNLFMLRSALNPEGAGGASAQSADSMSIAATSVVVSGPITASGNITATGPITAEGGGIAPGAPGAAEGTSNFNATKDAETEKKKKGGKNLPLKFKEYYSLGFFSQS